MRNKVYIVFVLVFFLISFKKQEYNRDISGTYKAVDDESCPLVIDIFKKNKGYRYSIVRNGKKETGIAELVLENDGEESVYFKGLKYWAYDKRYDDNSDIGGGFDDDTLIIQNYGNSMNEYTKFNECGGKYLAFVRK
jgi:hypothetical protein